MSRIADDTRIYQQFDPTGENGGYKFETVEETKDDCHINLQYDSKAMFLAGTITAEQARAKAEKLFVSQGLLIGGEFSGGIITGSQDKPAPKPDDSPAIDRVNEDDGTIVFSVGQQFVQEVTARNPDLEVSDYGMIDPKVHCFWKKHDDGTETSIYLYEELG